jgi:Tol biopolymer transport system component
MTQRNRFKMRVAVILLVMAAVGAFARQAGEDPAVLLERAVQLETIDGDLDAAIAIYKRIVDEFGDRRSVAAKALLRLGGCYEKLGEEQVMLAQKTFEKIIADYPDQTEEVKLAREKLAVFLRSGEPGEEADREFKITKIHEAKRRNGYMSPDGKILALVDYDGNGLWLKDITGNGEIRTLSIQGLIVDCWWSPDGQWIAYYDYAGDVYAIPAQGGEPKMIVDLDPEASKTGDYAYPMGWTSDSKKLTFQTAKGLFAVPGSGGEGEEIYKFPDPQKAKERHEWLTLSPDRTLIAYQSKQDDNMDIYVMSARGSEPTRITDDPARDEWPKWSYDGRWLMFGSDRTGEEELWVIKIRPDGRPEGFPIQVTRGGADNGNWTLDGKIAYSTSTDLTHVFTANPDGSQETQLTGQYKQNFGPRWSPDGKNIAFVAYYGEGVRTGVMTVSSSGGDTNFLARGGSPAWSPDGQRIAYCSERRSVARPINKATITIIPAKGGEAMELMNYDGYLVNLDWSPDGRHIAFDYSYDRMREGPNHIPDLPGSARDIYIVSVTGGEPERLTRIDMKKLSFESPRWSPDGKKIAFLWLDRTGAEETGILSKPPCIYTIDVEGGEPKFVTDENPMWWFCWTPDSRYIIFSNAEGLYKIPVSGGKAEKLNIQGRGPDLSPDGKKIAYYRRAEPKVDFWIVENFLPGDNREK